MEQDNKPQATQNSQVFKVRGMKTDFSESSAENSYAFENKNMRINIVDEDNTLLNLTNERGTKDTNVTLQGIPIGVKKYDINKALIFTTNNVGGVDVPEIIVKEESKFTPVISQTTSDISVSNFVDKIYNIEVNNDDIRTTELTSNIKIDSNLNFSAHNPLEIESFKDGSKNYFYLADGINNLKTFWLENNSIDGNYSNKRLDYNSRITGAETISASYFQSTVSEFYSGAIIYCFCYITKQGHKTNIIDITDVQYITSYDRYNTKQGLAPNSRCNVAFKIDLNNLSIEFNQVEIYSLFRSTLNGDIVVKKVSTSNYDNRTTLSIIDQNQGMAWSYQDLLTRFNSALIPSTICQKSNALFLGNITTNNYQNLAELMDTNLYTIKTTSGDGSLVGSNSSTNANAYYYGIQYQDIYGNWSPTMYIGYKQGIPSNVTINLTTTNKALQLGYVAARLMLLDNRRVRKNICQGIMLPTWKFEDDKYGINYFSPYFSEVSQEDIYKSYKIETPANSPHDIYSPDIEFDENFIIDNNTSYSVLYTAKTTLPLPVLTAEVFINGNEGIAYNEIEDTKKGKLLTDSYNNRIFHYFGAMTGYQKALQFGLWYQSEGSDMGTNILCPLRRLNDFDIKDHLVDYKVYLWQPSGSLDDSDGSTSVLKYKKISRYEAVWSSTFLYISSTKLRLFDGTTNNIPLNTDVYAGNINLTVYTKKANFDITQSSNQGRNSNGRTRDMWDTEQIPVVDNYAWDCMLTTIFMGQPIEFMTYKDYKDRIYSNVNKISRNSNWHETWATNWGAYFTNNVQYNPQNSPDIYIKLWKDTSLRAAGKDWEMVTNNVPHFRDAYYDGTTKTLYQYVATNDEVVDILCTGVHSRSKSIKIAYKTAKHLVTVGQFNSYPKKCAIFKENVTISNLSNEEIQNGQWIVCSQKVQLKQGFATTISNININEQYKWVKDYGGYECLKTTPYSQSDENQVTNVITTDSLYSYFNPMCRYDNLRNLQNYNGVTFDMFNKINTVYNQKNNFFIFSGITENTIADDTLENSIIYSDMKLANETEDSFVNFPTTNFYNIDTNINTINKLIVYNDKLLCFSNDAVCQVLYNENVVVNTDSVQSLGLASSDKITGTTLISNTFGCYNKWSMGIYNNILYFNDDLNNKIIAYTGEFTPINETFNIETLNSYFFKKSIWNPIDWNNTKLNIDLFGKDVHFTTPDIDIALNPTLGAFTSLYSYEQTPYVVNLGNHTIALREENKNTKLYYLREGDYNYFFNKGFQPYHTTVIMNQNSLVNKYMSFVEFSTEAYNNGSLLPNQNFTFDHITFWNDYQQNKMKVDYKIYGQSLLKKKFRIWRINRFRNNTKLFRRNYDTIANTWNYLKLSSEEPNKNKLTLHWININYR